jgi:hypothetical protein
MRLTTRKKTTPSKKVAKDDKTGQKQENEQFVGKETNLGRQILNYFHWSDRFYLDRINSGKIMAMKFGRYYWVQLARKGTPDIFGFDLQTGFVIFIETKVKKNKLSPEQATFAKKVRGTKNGIYILARSLDDVLDVLEPREPLPF